MKKLLFLIIFICSLTLTGCGDSGTAFLIDNPLQKNITVTLDGKVHELAPKSYIEIELGNGTHTLEYAGHTARFNVIEGAKGGIINPTLSNYYVHYIVYMEDTGLTRQKRLERERFYLGSSRIKTDWVNGHEITGGFRKENGIVIENYNSVEHNWVLGLDDDYKTSYTSSSAVGVFGKIFREADYINFLEERTGLDLSTPEGYEEPKRSFEGLQRTIPPITLVHECDSVNTYFSNMNTWLDTLHSNSSSATELKQAHQHLVMRQVEMSQAKNSCKPSFLNAQGLFDMERSNAYQQPEIDFDKLMRNSAIKHVFTITH